MYPGRLFFERYSSSRFRHAGVEKSPSLTSLAVMKRSRLANSCRSSITTTGLQRLNGIDGAGILLIGKSKSVRRRFREFLKDIQKNDLIPYRGFPILTPAGEGAELPLSFGQKASKRHPLQLGFVGKQGPPSCGRRSMRHIGSSMRKGISEMFFERTAVSSCQQVNWPRNRYLIPGQLSPVLQQPGREECPPALSNLTCQLLRNLTSIHESNGQLTSQFSFPSKESDRSHPVIFQRPNRGL